MGTESGWLMNIRGTTHTWTASTCRCNICLKEEDDSAVDIVDNTCLLRELTSLALRASSSGVFTISRSPDDREPE
ncbi:hypothetical protein IGI04_025540 [Brassica rapa subsp. trilocularis]|uniref:CENP-V/GFA domain-containing protein n=1 Tax=Brassica rapa subsp. trilocularis TaxID=1813537 RepID=A0ABQ7KXA6_BRACM|nr:hypothetical protein IGI04_025540 [Brassica rapa subsp. trilocularis]